MSIYSVSLKLTERAYIPLEDPMISAIFGGVLAGFTTGLYLKILVQLLPHMSLKCKVGVESETQSYIWGGAVGDRGSCD